MARKKPSKKGPVKSGFTMEIEENLRPEVDDPTKIERRKNMFKWALIVSPFIAGAAILGMVYQQSTITTLMEQLDVAPLGSEMDSPGKSTAMESVRVWLALPAAPIPGARLVSWDGAETQSRYEMIIDKDSGKEIETLGRELHRFTVAGKGGHLYKVTTQTTFAPLRGANVIGIPTVTPLAPDNVASLVLTSSWPDLVDSTAPEGATTAVQAWAEAFTSGEPERLLQAVGDPDSTHGYLPLTGVKKATATIEASANDEEMEKLGTLVARVDLAMEWAGEKYDNDQGPIISYDVLIAKADTASPVVVSWGPVGTGHELKPFDNAYPGLKFTMNGKDVTSEYIPEEEL